MLGTSRVVATLALLCVCACGTGDTKVDPGDLELRDLLGVAPEVATSWDADQRVSARRILVGSLDEISGDPIRVELAPGQSPDDQIARTLANLDSRRFAAGDNALGFVRVELTTTELTARLATAPTLVATAGGDAPPRAITLELSDRWGTLPAKSRDVLTALAIDAGHESGRLVVTPMPRLAVIAAYAAGTPARLDVNPVLLAAIDPSATETLVTTTRVAGGAAATDTVATTPTKPTAAGNPYSFYGSIAECAYAQRLRCESCLSSNSCLPVTNTTDGNAECTTLAGGDGRGYFLLCINQALAITSVNQCAGDSVGGCARNTGAANDLGQLNSNSNFLDDSTCSAGLDGCLADIYGEPQNPFPGIVDGGVSPPPDPPRNTDVSCGDSCDNNNSGNSNCEASPNCNCEGPSCNNSLSCDSTCASSNDQSGCGSCDSCESSSGGGGGGGGCSSDSSSGGGGGDCGSCDSSSSGGGGSCGSCDSSSSGGGGGGGGCGGDCGGGSGGGDSCGGGGGSCGGGGGGSSSCDVTKKNPSAGFAVALSLTWAFLPIPLAAAVRRRARKKKRAQAAPPPEPNADEAARDEEVVS